MKLDITYKDVFRYYLKKIALVKRETTILIITRLILLGETVLTPIFIKNLIEALQGGIEQSDIVWKQLIYIAIIAGANFIGWRIVEYYVISAQLKPMREIAKEGFDYIHRHGSTFFANTMSGTLLKKIKNGIDAFEGLFDILIFELITPIGITVGAVCILGRENKILGIGFAMWIIIYISFQSYMYNIKGKYEDHEESVKSARSGYITDTFSNHSTIENSGSLQYEKDLHKEKIDQVYHASRKNWGFDNIIAGTTGFLMNGLWIGGLIGGVILRQKQLLSLPIFVLMILYMDQIFGQLRGIGKVFKRVSTLLAQAKEYLIIMKTPHEIMDTPHARQLHITDCTIKFQNAAFTYNTESLKTTQAIKNITLTIAQGEHIGLVGTSGAGKSTLVKLLFRLFDLSSGSIMIGGVDIRDFTLTSIRSQISYVPQEPILFHRTLRENIMYGRPDASEADIIESAERAQAHDFICALPDGYDSFVGERGVKLSGGQRQRVAIARAILHDAPIIVLDEATSSLDSVTESDIQLAIQEVMKGKTAIIIAHRLGTVKHLDRILVMQDGTFIEEGTHQELIQDASGTYAGLREKQT